MFTKVERYLIAITILFIIITLFVRFLVYYYPLHVAKNNAQKIINSDYSEIETISVLRLCLFQAKGSKSVTKAIINTFENFYNGLDKFRFVHFFKSNEIYSCPYVKIGLKNCIKFFRKIRISAENFPQIRDRVSQCEEIIKLNCIENEKNKEIINNSLKQYLDREKKFIEINKWNFSLNENRSPTKKIHTEKRVSPIKKIQIAQLKKDNKANIPNDKIASANGNNNFKESLKSSAGKKEDKSNSKNIDINKAFDIFKDEANKAGILLKNLKFDKRTSKLTVNFESGYIKTEVFVTQLKTLFDMVYRIFTLNNFPINLLKINASDNIDHVLMYSVELDVNDLKMYKEGNINSGQFRKRWREKEY